MCIKPIDEEYYKRQSNIYSLLFQAYIDKSLLNSVDTFKSHLPPETNDEINRTIFVLAHICDITKRDLALTLWKVYYDNGADANTVKALSRYLYTKHNIRYRINESDNIKKIQHLIKNARHGFIAHNLMDDTGRMLQISDIFNALEDIRTIFNDLCLQTQTVDHRVKPITNTEIMDIALNVKMGFDPLILRALDHQCTDEEGD